MDVFHDGDVAVEVEVAYLEEAEEPQVPALPQNIFVEAVSLNTDLAEVYSRKPHLLRHAVNAILASRAPGTVKAYEASLRHFREFCVANDHPFPFFTTEAVLEFVLEKVGSSAPFGFFANIKPALCLLDECLGRQTIFPSALETALTGAKKICREAAGPVKKAPRVSVTEIKALLDKFVIPFADRIGEADPAHFRTIFRLVVEYHTLCRLSCFQKLQAKHLEISGPDVVVTFPSAKNDQLHQGRTLVLVASGSPYCPVRLAKLFFARFGLTFGPDSTDNTFLNFQLRRESGRLLPIRHKCLSYTGSTEALRAVFSAAGIHRKGLTDKCIKMTGVTTAYEGGASSEEVMHLGRWKTPSIPLRYKINSLEFKRQVASKIPDLGV